MKRSHINSNFDPSSVSNDGYSTYAGAHKVSPVGHKLVPIAIATPEGTTAAASAQNVGAGATLAIYNNAGSVGSVTTGMVGVASLAPGATAASSDPANITPSVGVPCKPNDWTYINTWDHTHVIVSAATLLVFVVKDDTIVTK